MPRDSRLYMTFPIDFDEHPKVAPLSDAAFRTFIEMNAYSRRQSLDGRIAAATARRRWKSKPLADLVASHPERPLIALVGDEYVIRDYAEHQLTTTEIESLREKRAAAGRKGGTAKASAKASATAIAKQGAVATNKQSQESRDDLTDIKNLPESSPVSDARAGANYDVGDVGGFLRSITARALLRAEAAGVKDLYAIRDLFETTTLEKLTLGATVELVEAIIARAADQVRNADAYVATVCRTTPDEVRELVTQIDVEAIA